MSTNKNPLDSPTSNGVPISPTTQPGLPGLDSPTAINIPISPPANPNSKPLSDFDFEEDAIKVLPCPPGQCVVVLTGIMGAVSNSGNPQLVVKESVDVAASKAIGLGHTMDENVLYRSVTSFFGLPTDADEKPTREAKLGNLQAFADKYQVPRKWFALCIHRESIVQSNFESVVSSNPRAMAVISLRKEINGDRMFPEIENRGIYQSKIK